MNQTGFLSETYWNNRYLNRETGWDIGFVATPLKEYVDQLTGKKMSILIPGAGNGHEASYLFEAGFAQVHVLDFAAEPLLAFHKKHPAFPKENLIEQDFFKHTGQYGLIVEQTFFCALSPKLRPQYVRHMHSLLKPNGKLIGLLFNDPLPGDNPPFGGDVKLYQELFSPYFEIAIMETAYNSIAPRKGRELFVKMIPKKAGNQ
jgi:SAM-dependent methyltransferase